MFRSPDIGLDIGNSKFSLCVRGEGVIASEPSYVAFRGDRLTDASLVAIGDEAKRMYERSHPGITVATPMAEGVVVDCQAASVLLKRLSKQAGLRTGIAKPRAIVGALFGSSDIEKKAFRNVAESISGRSVYVVPEPLAAAIGAGLEINEPYANMILDIGDGATEGIVMSQRKTIVGSSMRFGGSSVDALLIEHLRKKHDIKVSVSQARNIKEAVTSELSEGNSDQSVRVKGINTRTLLPCEREVPRSSVLGVLDLFADRIANFTLNLLSRVPPEVSVDLIENGIYLCGGASQSNLIKEKIAEVTNLKVTALDDPQLSVITGIHKMLDFARYFV